MPNPPHTPRSHLIVDVTNGQHIHPNLRLALNQQLDDVVMDLEAAYARTRTNPHPRPVQISITIAYNISELLGPNTTPPFPPQPADQINQVGSGNLRVDVQIGRLPFLDLAPDPGPRYMFDAAANLVGSLPTVDVNELPEDGKICPVCTEGFVGGAEDRPVILRCGHVVGRKCIEQWILGRHNTCVICRAAIFEPGQLR